MINILVTAIGGSGHGEQVLKALLLANRKEFRIFGADSDSGCPQKSLVYDFQVLPSASSPNYETELFALLDKFQIKVLIHGCEPEMQFFLKIKHLLESRGILILMNNKEVINLCTNKLLTGMRLNELGFQCPKFQEVSSIEEIEEIDWFPVVVKPKTGSGGSKNVFICQTKFELVNLARYLTGEFGILDIMIQEYVGTFDQEFTVGVLSDLDGNFINSIALRRKMSGQLNIRSSVSNQTGNAKFGSKLVISSGVSHGEIAEFNEVRRQCEAIAKSIGSTGPLNIQCRFVDGVVNVFEINPRFSGTTSLRALVGFNEPELLIKRHILGETIEPRFKFRNATIIRTLHENIL